MRLAFVTVGYTRGSSEFNEPPEPPKVGGHRYNLRLISGLRERGVEVEEIVASRESAGDQLAARSSLGGRLAPEEFDAIAVDALARISFYPHLDRWRRSAPVVALVHELPSVADPDAGERVFEEPLLRADRLVTVSRHGASVLRGRGVPTGRIHVVPPGVERPAGFTPGDARRDGTPRVLCVAQWIPRKNITGLVSAWGTLHGISPGTEAVLELVGETGSDPAYAARVRRTISRVSKTPGADSVVVRGPVSEGGLRRAYETASVFALPSLYEGYGMVYAEALSYGLPVVALDVGPVPELLGEAGLLVETGDERGLAAAILGPLLEPGLREKLSQVALRRAGNLPGWEDTVDGFLAALEAAVAGAATR